MFHPQYGYDPRSWQGFQPGQGYPQPNFPSAQLPYQQPNHGTIPPMSFNQPCLPNNIATWRQPPMNPMMQLQHPVQFGPNLLSQTPPPGTGEHHFQIGSNTYPGQQARPPIPGQVQTIGPHGGGVGMASNQNANPGHVNIPPTFNNQVPIYNAHSPVHPSAHNHPFTGVFPNSQMQNPHSFPHQLPGNFNAPGNTASGQVPNAPPLPPNPFPTMSKPPLPGQMSITPSLSGQLLTGLPPQTHGLIESRETKDLKRSDKVPIRCGTKDMNPSSKNTKTQDSPSKKHHTEQTSRRLQKELVSPRKRKGERSLSTSRPVSKKPRYDNSESSKRKEHDRNKIHRSGERSNSSRTLHKDISASYSNTRTDNSNQNLHNQDRQRKDGYESGAHFSKSCETKRRDIPLRCVSPPAPDVKRRIKFIVPEDLYQLARQGTPPRTIVTGTKDLEKMYEKFEKKVLNISNEVQSTQSKDLPGLTESLDRKDLDDRVEEDTFDFDSLDGSDFDDTERAKEEYTADSFAGNDDSEDSDEDQNDDDIGESSSDDECTVSNPEITIHEYRQRKLSDPRRLHQDLWFNEKEEGNDGPVCKCCTKDKEHGIRHAVYPGEKDIPLCDPLSNNANKLYHYWMTITPHCNFMTERPTVIKHRDKDYVFEGFSLISHEPLDLIPTCSFIRFNIEYTIHLVKEPIPKNFCIKGLDLFSKFLFSNILELFDWMLKGPDKKGCPIFHVIPRFILRQNDRQDGKEIHELLSMDKVLYHLMKSSSELLIKPHHLTMPKQKERTFAKAHYNNIVTKPDKKPAAFRIDDILFDNEIEHDDKKAYPLVLHQGIRPVQMSYSGNPKYQKLWKSYIRLRNTMTNKPCTSRKEHDRLVEMKIGLEKMRLKSSMRRDVEVTTSSEGLKKTGINSDVCQHAMVLPVLVHHLRYHMCLKTLDSKLGYKFKDRTLLQLALTHPSYHLNFGMNPDQARNTLTNCGIKLPRYGDRKIHRMNTKKKGITQLIRIMANLGRIEENQSMIRHNERLEFLGDAVLEFICSSHLFFVLPEANEGHLAMYRSALVQNSHLSVLAKSFNLSDYMQYSHGPDLCKEEDLDHAMANCFEAILGAIFLEGGLQAASDFFTKMAFREEKQRSVWISKPKHPLQLQQPNGDRHLIPSSPVLQKLQEFEESTGITFNHIRLLARAFTHPQVGFNNLTLGDNQRMEFLGDSVLQLIVSIYLYRHFPDHHEGHLTLLRSSLVNNRTQAEVSRQLVMDNYINFGSKEVKNIREKLLADVLEAFLAALYIDKGIKHVEMFCRVCFFPRVEDNIVNQEWIDSKSQLQQCCLALRQERKQPDLPVYKVLQDAGPSHHKKFQVAVYYKGKRVGTGEGHSMHVAEMAAAKDALASSYFPELARQKHLLDGKHQKKRSRKYEPPKPRDKPPVAKETDNEPAWVEHH